MAERDEVREVEHRASDRTDRTLLRALLRAQSAAERRHHWRALSQRLEPLIATCVARAARRDRQRWAGDERDDLINDVWVALLRDDLSKLRQYDARRGFQLTSFVGLVATHVTIDRLRARRSERRAIDASEVLARAVAPTTTDDVEWRDQVVRAQAALARLSPADRELFSLYIEDERSPETIARDYGLSVSSIYSRKCKIRRRLQEMLRRGEV